MRPIHTTAWAILTICCLAVTATAGTRTVSGSIDSASEVNHWRFNIDQISDLYIDVQAWESCGRYGLKPYIPRDFFGDGENNNKLIANIYLFQEPDHLMIGSCTGRLPGDTVDGAHTYRSGRNSYLSLNALSPGTYILAIGSGELSQADAWAGTNTLGSYYNDPPSDYHRYNVIFTAPSGNVRLQHALTVNTVGSGSVTPTSGFYNEGSLQLTASPDAGWDFTQWDDDAAGTNESVTITLDAGKTVTATFTELGRYALVVTTIGSGSVTPPGGSYYDGDSVTLTAEPEDEYWQFDGWSGDLSGTAVSATLVMNATRNATATFSLKDTDGDGLSDRDEDAGAHEGDGNRDGTQDSLQGHVACLKIHDGQYQVTLESGPGTTLSACSANANPHPDECPDWAEFPYGFFDFTITGLTHGGATTLTLHLPDGQGAAVANTYYKYGPLPTDPTPQWYRFKYENSLQVGALFNGTTVTIHLIDGAMGDDDLTADGTIQDVGGPGRLLVTGGSAPGGPTPADGGGGGGGCLIDVVRN